MIYITKNNDLCHDRNLKILKIFDLNSRVIFMSVDVTLQDGQRFDYASLDADTCQFVQQQTGEIRNLMKRTAQGIIEIGRKLIAVKARLGHGRFGNWLAAEFEWTWKTATRFMNVAEQFNFDNLSNLDIAPSALYILAAPSTPKVVCEELIARALAGEPITYTTAKLLKQKYTKPTGRPKTKAQLEPEQKPVVSPPQPSSTLSPLSGSQIEVVAIRPQASAKVAITKNIRSEAASIIVPQLPSPVSAFNEPGVWWQLGGRHLLYCGNPNSDEFIARVPEDVQLFLAFPPARVWQPRILADACIILSDYLPIFNRLELLDEVLEPLILNNSRLNELVVTCFLPSPVILSVLNRLSRRGLLAEPSSRRCKAIVADWKRVGLSAERVSYVVTD